MAKAKKIKKEELSKAQEVSQEYNNLMVALGNIELQKQDIVMKAAKVRANIEEIKKDLQAVYGNVNIDLATGKYEESAEDKKD
tara:strand:+ start:781 stop:1029 length:249 start_codon:yes stop_codon:yes gene_type:complete